MLLVLREVRKELAGAVFGCFAGRYAKALVQIGAQFRVEIDEGSGHLAPVAEFERAFADASAGDHPDGVGGAAIDLDEDDGTLAVRVQFSGVEELAAGLIDAEAAKGELGHAHTEDLTGAEMAVSTFGFPEQLLELATDGLGAFGGGIGCVRRHIPMLRRCIIARMADSEFAGTQWWQTGVIYQIYPRSFQDSNGDGVGDLKGITARLDYLVALGVDAIWISPIYPSPMADFGYDVADYCGVDPLFGTMADFDALLSAAHAKGLRVILDFVPNHTSDQHPWFLESRSSRTNAKRDWYLWRDAHPSEQGSTGTPGDAAGPNGSEDRRPASQRYPNNWTSHFGGPSWAWDEATEQFYLHSFLKQQPDLNWRNPEVRAAIYQAMRFWLDKGVDGFRMDVLWLLIKDEHFRDNPTNLEYSPGMHDHAKTLPLYNADQPGTHRIVAAMRALMDSYGPTLPGSGEAGGALDPETQAPMAESHRVLIGEIYLPLPELVRYYFGREPQTGGTEGTSPEIPELRGANLPFNFHLIQTEWSATRIAEIVQSYELLLPSGAWPNYVLGNHDQPRLATRVGAQQARAAAMLLLTLRGTPTLYYGDELGMEDVAVPAADVQDPAEKNEPGKGRGRDPERSPMLWVDAPNAGFTSPGVKPWLPLQANWPTMNAKMQSGQERSTLQLYRRLLALRREHPALHLGAISDVTTEGTVLRFCRQEQGKGNAGQKFQVLLNLSQEPAVAQCQRGRVVLTTLLDGEGGLVDGPVTLEAGEGLLIEIGREVN